MLLASTDCRRPALNTLAGQSAQGLASSGTSASALVCSHLASLAVSRSGMARAPGLQHSEWHELDLAAQWLRVRRQAADRARTRLDRQRELRRGGVAPEQTD